MIVNHPDGTYTIVTTEHDGGDEDRRDVMSLDSPDWLHRKDAIRSSAIDVGGIARCGSWLPGRFLTNIDVMVTCPSCLCISVEVTDSRPVSPRALVEARHRGFYRGNRR